MAGRSMLSTSPGAQALVEANALVDEGRPLDAIEVLRAANREHPDPGLDRRLAQVRHAAFASLEPRSAFEHWPVPVDDLVTDGTACIPEITPEELDAETLRRNILAHGSVRVRGLFDDERVSTFVDGIETTLAVRSSGAADDPSQSWVATLPLSREEARSLGRRFVAGDGGILAADAPRLLSTLFETYEQIGLREVVAGYLGERPVLSANKCTMRRARLDGGTDWHQDGAFLGQPGIRVLNVWVALTDCGVDAPGMDLVPKRMDRILETGTGGAVFDWAVGPEVVARVAADAPVVRPEFNAGDALLFDELFLHRTALASTMTRTRHAIESWFFAPTDYPADQVPLVW
jgi:hypothetical protein